jgi:uncharacterized protein YndB with AHSA1/START domain
MIAAENSQPRPSAGMRRATGRDRADWFGLLDAWGAAGRPYREIADWLTSEHDLTAWWAQKLIVEYEEARALRAPGVRRDGRFEVGASKTVAVPVDRLFDAFVDPRLRDGWLPHARMRESARDPGRLVRFEWNEGASRVTVSFTALGDTKSEVSVQHEQLPDAGSAEEMKAFWRERLAAMKAVLEGRD